MGFTPQITITITTTFRAPHSQSSARRANIILFFSLFFFYFRGVKGGITRSLLCRQCTLSSHCAAFLHLVLSYHYLLLVFMRICFIISGVVDNKMSVLLYDTTGAQDVCINQFLVQHGYCQTAGLG